MLKKLNKKLKKHQPLINSVGILLALIGIYFTFFQTIQSHNELRRSVYKFNGEQYPTVKFETLDKKTGILKISILQTDMLFQSSRITHHDSLASGHQEIIMLHDSIWFNVKLFSYFKFDKEINIRFKKMMSDNDFNSFINIRTPVLMEINYVKYGESRIVNGIFDLEFSYFKDYMNDQKKYESEIRAIYFRKYIETEENIDEILNMQKVFQIINGA